MKLLDNFFTIASTEASDEEFRCQIQLNARHEYYKVHFPGNPITPGVCLIQIATEILEMKYNKSFLLTSAGSIKFKRTVGPNDVPVLVFSKIIFDDTKLSTNVSIEDGEGQFVKMSLGFTTIA